MYIDWFTFLNILSTRNTLLLYNKLNMQCYDIINIDTLEKDGIISNNTDNNNYYNVVIKLV